LNLGWLTNDFVRGKQGDSFVSLRSPLAYANSFKFSVLRPVLGVGIEGCETLTLTGNPSAQCQMASNKLVRKDCMNIARIELMRRLQREYYEELRGVGAVRLVRCPHSPRVMLLYRLCVAFSLGVIIAFIVSRF